MGKDFPVLASFCLAMQPAALTGRGHSQLPCWHQASGLEIHHGVRGHSWQGENPSFPAAQLKPLGVICSPLPREVAAGKGCRCVTHTAITRFRGRGHSPRQRRGRDGEGKKLPYYSVLSPRTRASGLRLRIPPTHAGLGPLAATTRRERKGREGGESRGIAPPAARHPGTGASRKSGC